jgi:hypothetical protein
MVLMFIFNGRILKRREKEGKSASVLKNEK